MALYKRRAKNVLAFCISCIDKIISNFNRWQWLMKYTGHRRSLREATKRMKRYISLVKYLSKNDNILGSSHIYDLT